jgi:hypothetical protein
MQRMNKVLSGEQYTAQFVIGSAGTLKFSE